VVREIGSTVFIVGGLEWARGEACGVTIQKADSTILRLEDIATAGLCDLDAVSDSMRIVGHGLEVVLARYHRSQCELAEAMRIKAPTNWFLHPVP
jgi:hypothetical protein